MSKDLVFHCITLFYIIFNSGRVLSYLPQIWAVAREKSSATAISLITWTFWTLANLSTGLYASFIVPDFLLSIMSYGNAVGCAIVVGLVILKRFTYPHIKTVNVKSESSLSEVPSLKPLNFDSEIK